MTNLCPTCGHVLPPKQPFDIHLTPLERRIVNCLWRAQGPIPKDQLLAAMYGDREDGGPLTVKDTANVLIHQLRKKLHPLGYTIKGKSYSRWSTGTVELKKLTEIANGHQ